MKKIASAIIIPIIIFALFNATIAVLFNFKPTLDIIIWLYYAPCTIEIILSLIVTTKKSKRR